MTKFSYKRNLLFCVTISLLFIFKSTNAHFIDSEDTKEGEIIDKELELFKSLFNGLEILKSNDAEHDDENETNDDDNKSVIEIFKEKVNDDGNSKESNDNISYTSEELKSNDVNETMSHINIVKVEDKENEIKDSNVQEDTKNEIKEKEDINNENKTMESSISNDNQEDNVKKVQLVTDHQTFKETDDNNINNINSEDADKENDENIKNLVEEVVESDGTSNDNTEILKEDIFNKAKEAIHRTMMKSTNYQLDKLAKAKEEDLKKGVKFLKPNEKHINNNNDNVPGGIFKIEDNFEYKCFFDQECTNFKGFTPDVASCNKTIRRCSNYCFVQKACLLDSDCSTSCGSWCLREDDMVFGRCVMSFDEGDFCMESWRVCNEGLTCNINTYICEKQRIPITFTRIGSQESLLSIIIFLLVAVYLIKNSRTNNFISFFSGYNLNDYCSTNTQDYDPLPEYQRTEVLNQDEMDELLEPPPDTDAPSNVEEAAAYCGYAVENSYDERPVPYDPYDEPTIMYDVPPEGEPPVDHESSANNVISSNNTSSAIVLSPVNNNLTPVNENGDVNVHISSMSSLSDTDMMEPPPDYESSIFN